MTGDDFFRLPALALAALMLESPQETVAALKAIEQALREDEDADLLETIFQQQPTIGG